MLPSFEIFLCILTDSWMPWLEDNRKPDKFESVIRTAGPSFQTSHPEFFTAIIRAFKRLHIGLSEKLITELEQLSSSDESPFGRKLGQAFVNQPVLSFREYFYNALTGQALAAYHDLTEQFFRQNKGAETKSFYVEKILSDLHAQMHIPVPRKFEFPEEETIVFSVKLAIALQFQLILKKHGTPDSILSYFDTRGWLEKTVQQNQYSGHFLSLFDSFAGNGQPTGQVKVPVITEIEPGFSEDETALHDDETLSDLVMGLQQDIREVKQNFKTITQNNQLQQKEEKHAQKWLTSAEVCETLRISKSTLSRYRDSGKIIFSRLGNKIRYKKNDILQIIKENESTNRKQ